MKGAFPQDIFEKIGGIGILGLPYPEEYGGAGSDFVGYAIAVEEISRACSSIGIGLSVHISLCAWLIYKYGTNKNRNSCVR